jgi:hypothetical protein
VITADFSAEPAADGGVGAAAPPLQEMLQAARLNHNRLARAVRIHFNARSVP